MDWEQFRQIVRAAAGHGSPGQQFVFDALGAESLARARIPLSILAGRDLAALEAALRGRPFPGTVVGGPR